MAKKLALLGAVRGGYEKEIHDILQICGHCWTGWTYYINKDAKIILDKQFSNDKYFHIFVHDVEKPKDKSFPKGRGCVWYKIKVKEYKFETSTDENCTTYRDRNDKHSLAACVFEPIIEIKPKKWNEFDDYFRGGPISSKYPWRGTNSPFGCIADE